MIILIPVSLFTIFVGSHGNVILRGQLTVGGLFQIQNEVGGKCDGIAPLSVKGLEAVKWIFRKLNDANYIPGVTIGLEVWPTCGIVSEAVDQTVDMLLRIREERSNLTTIPLVGLIGPEYSSEAQKVSYMLSTQRSDDRVLQVGFSTTAASLSDTNMYSNFARVVPSDAVQSEVIIALMKELEWNYIAIIYDNDVYGIEGRDSLIKQAAANSICIAKNVSLSTGALSLLTLQQLLTDIITNTESPINSAVVFASDLHVNSILSAATSLRSTISDHLSFIVSESVGLSDTFFKKSDGTLFSAAKGVYAVNPPRLYVDEFELYWTSMFRNVSMVIEEAASNPWLRDVFRLHSGCTLSSDPAVPGCSNLGASKLSEVSETSTWTSYAMKAAYVMAKTLKGTHDQYCPFSTGICSNLKTALHADRGSVLSFFRNSISSVDFKQDFPYTPVEFDSTSFVFTGNDVQYLAGFPNYEAYQYRKCINDASQFCFEKLGTYQDSSLSINKSLIRDYNSNANGNIWPNVNYAQCTEGKRCSSCIAVDKAEEIYFLDGDIIVGGIIPVYDTGTGSPVSCGNIRKKNGNELVQAFEYVVNLINRKVAPYDNLFPGKSIGFLFINSCDQPLLIKQKLLNLFHDGYFVRNGKTINLREKLIGFAGPYSSSMSIATANIFSDFNYVQVAYASTANDLSNRGDYPYYTRVSTPDSKQTKAMIRIIKHKVYKSSYIQIVYSKGTYGEAGRDAIKSQAEVEGICVIQEIEVSDNTNLNIVLPTLRGRPFARIVILFLRSHQVENLATALEDDMDWGEFMFIGSEEWGYRPDAFTTKQKLVGSIILSLQLPENKDFTNYLGRISALTQSANPWLYEYIAAKYSCHIPLSFDKTFTKPCDPDMTLANNDTYEQEIWTPFALRAMTALLAGSSDAFIELCGSGSSILCLRYRNNPVTIRNKIINQSIKNESGHDVRIFDNNGDGNVGYIIYNLQRDRNDANQVVYKEVGKFSADGKVFELKEQDIVLPDSIELPSVCPNERQCNLCRGPLPNATTAPVVESSGGAVSALGAVVGILVVLLIIVVVVAVCLFRRMRAAGAKPDDYNYLTAIPDPTDRNMYDGRNHAFHHDETSRRTASLNHGPSNERAPPLNRGPSSGTWSTSLNHGPSRNNSVQSARSEPNIVDPYLDPVDAYPSLENDQHSNQSSTVPKKLESPPPSHSSSINKNSNFYSQNGSGKIKHSGDSDDSLTKEKQLNISISQQDGACGDGNVTSETHQSSSPGSMTEKPKFERNTSEHSNFVHDGSPPLAPARKRQQVAVVSAVPKESE